MWRVAFKGLTQSVEIIYCKGVSYDNYPNTTLLDISKPCKFDMNPSIIKLEAISFNKYRKCKQIVIPSWNLLEVVEFEPKEDPNKSKVRVVKNGQEKPTINKITPIKPPSME